MEFNSTMDKSAAELGDRGPLPRVNENGRRQQLPGSLHEMFHRTRFRSWACAGALLAASPSASLRFVTTESCGLVAAGGAQLRLTGNIARRDGCACLRRASKVGELYNEIPDRVSDAAVFIGAGFAWGGNIALGYIATILAIFTAYIRAAGKIAGAPNEFCGPMAKQHRMLVITLICLYSAITPRPGR